MIPTEVSLVIRRDRLRTFWLLFFFFSELTKREITNCRFLSFIDED